MANSYITQLIELYEVQVKKHIERQNPDISDALAMASLHLNHLQQARDRCDFDNQLYYVNRISRILGEVDGYLAAKEKTACSD
jgi:hypothetical protein